MKKPYTDKQGQYLAFICYYGRIHGCPPAESEMQQYFRVSPPSVHQMILTLETHGLIERTPAIQATGLRLLPRQGYLLLDMPAFAGHTTGRAPFVMHPALREH